MPDDDLLREREAFGAAVRKLRRDRYLSQDHVERAGGLARSQVGAIERADKDVQLSTLIRLARGLDLPLSEVVLAYERRAV